MNAPSLLRKSAISALGRHLSDPFLSWNLTPYVIMLWWYRKKKYFPVWDFWYFWCKGQGQQHPGSPNCTFLLVQDLKEWVAVESDSIQPHLRKEVMRMMTLAADRLTALGATVNLVNLGSHQVLIWFLDLKHHIYTWVYLLHSVLHTRM